MIEEKKHHKSGHCLKTEPENTEVLSRDKEIIEAFKKVVCWKFCKKLKGRHTEVTKEFSLHFNGLMTKVGLLDMQVSPEIITLVTEIPSGKEF